MKKVFLFLMVLLWMNGASASPLWIGPDDTHTEGFYSIGKECPSDKPVGSWHWGVPCAGIECIDFRWQYVCEKKCDDLDAFPIEKGKEKGFEICSNRETVRSMLGGYQSQLKECPEYFIHDKDGNCTAIDGRYSFLNLTEERCQELTFYRWMYGYCVKYNQIDWAASKLSRKECEKYDDLTWDEQKQECLIKCPEGEIRDFSGNCLSCSSENGIHTSFENCAKCVDGNGNPIREMYEYYCCLIECPKGTFKDNKGECKPCDGKRFISTSPEECAKCVDENGNPIRKMQDDLCAFVYSEKMYFISNDGNYRSCLEETPYVASPEECAKCVDENGNPTRKIYKNVIGDPRFDNRCGLINCPEGQFPVVLGGCMPCTHLLPEPVESAEACAVCQDENGNPIRRMYKGTFNHPDVSDGCGLIECPKDMFLGKFGHCISCSDVREYDSTAEECAKCSSLRVYDTDTQKCVLNK